MMSNKFLFLLEKDSFSTKSRVLFQNIFRRNHKMFSQEKSGAFLLGLRLQIRIQREILC